MSYGGCVEKYSPAGIELKWQKFWKEEKLFKAEKDPKKKKRYIFSTAKSRMHT